MADARKNSRPDAFNLAEVLRMLEEEELDGDCISSDEESDLDHELYDMDRELR